MRLGTHVRDRVTLQTEHSLRHDTAAGDGYPASTLTISIEGPEPLSLFVRCVSIHLPEHTPARQRSGLRGLPEICLSANGLPKPSPPCANWPKPANWIDPAPQGLPR